jgi:hypothetical protein
VVPLSAITSSPRGPEQESSRTIEAPVCNADLADHCAAKCMRACGLNNTSEDSKSIISQAPAVVVNSVFSVCSAAFGSPDVPEVKSTTETASGSSLASSNATGWRCSHGVSSNNGVNSISPFPARPRTTR